MTKKHAKLPSMQRVKVPVSTAADHFLFFINYFSEKIRLDLSYESSAKWTIHMKCQALQNMIFHVNHLQMIHMGCQALFSLINKTEATKKKKKKKRKKEKKRKENVVCYNFAQRYESQLQIDIFFLFLH